MTLELHGPQGTRMIVVSDPDPARESYERAWVRVAQAIAVETPETSEPETRQDDLLECGCESCIRKWEARS